MTSTEIVALIGAASTVGVAVSSYGFNYVAANRNSEANRQLAEDAQAHERQLRQAERGYEDKKAA